MDTVILIETRARLAHNKVVRVVFLLGGVEVQSVDVTADSGRQQVKLKDRGLGFVRVDRESGHAKIHASGPEGFSARYLMVRISNGHGSRKTHNRPRVVAKI